MRGSLECFFEALRESGAVSPRALAATTPTMREKAFHAADTALVNLDSAAPFPIVAKSRPVRRIQNPAPQAPPAFQSAVD